MCQQVHVEEEWGDADEDEPEPDDNVDLESILWNSFGQILFTFKFVIMYDHIWLYNT
jgi:hypothetical protein